MALLIPTRTAQWPLTAEFVFNYNDTMVPAAGGSAVDFGLTNTSATTVEIIKLPPSSIILSGQIVTETTFTHAMTITIGDSTTADRYFASTAITTAGAFTFVPTGFTNPTGLNLRMTFTATTGSFTAGKASIRVSYVIRGKANEVQTT